MHAKSTQRYLTVLAACLTVAILLGAVPAWAAAPAEAPGTPQPVSAQVVETRIKEVEAREDLDAPTKGKLIELYRKTLSQLETRAANAKAAAAFTAARTSAPIETKEIRQQLDKTLTSPSRASMNVSEQTPVSELEQLLAKEKADLAALRAKLADIDAMLETEVNRPNEVRARLTEAKERQEQVTQDLNAPAPPDQLPELTEARRWHLAAQRSALSAEIHMLDQELLSQPMRLELLRARRDQTARSVSHVSERVNVLEALLSELRVSEAEEARVEAETAEQAAAGKHPLIQKLAEQNAQLTEHLSEVAAELDAINKQVDEVNQRAMRIEESLRSAQKKLEIAGMSKALGSRLVGDRRRLPDARALQRRAPAREAAIGEAGLSQVRYGEERRRLSDLDRAVDQMVSELPAEQQPAVREELVELAKTRRELLDKALLTNSAYLGALTELDLARKRLGEAVEAYDAWLAENLMWIRTAPAMGLDSLGNIPGESKPFFSASNWSDVGKTLAYETTHSPYFLPAMAAWLLLLAARRRLHLLLMDTGRLAGDPEQDHIHYSLRALGLTLLLALTWPVLSIGTGWELQSSQAAGQFTQQIGRALVALSPGLFLLRVLRWLCTPGGLADRHLRWDPTQLSGLRQHVRWLTPVLLILVFIAIVAGQRESETDSLDLSRLAFIALMIALSVFLGRVFSPRRTVLGGYLRRNPHSWPSRLRHLWYPVLVGAPLVLAGLVFAGYYFAGGLLARSLVYTLGLLLGLIVVHELVLRWLRLTRRQLLREQARRARESQTEAATSEEEVQEAPDLESIDAQTRKLLDTGVVLAAVAGFAAIWADILPALGILEQVSLWQQTVSVDGADKVVPVTLGDLMLAFVVGFVTVIAARNLPAVIEIVMLRGTSLDPGSRYAAITLLRYAIVGVGIVLLFGILGGNWSQIQWLVAALGVGIGFGLQEIVANFISGIIILFERPIRVGDVVSVGDTSGVVSRIRIRATTIRNWDNQELLVPNKEFITTRLLNWTLSDELIRLVITVGVAYGSDIQKAMKLMAESAEEHPRILDDPAPLVTFEGFGDNALTLVLRCHMESLEDRLTVASNLHEAINAKFGQNGVVVAFPQRDLHIDSVRPLEIRLRRDRPYNDTP